MRNSIQPSLLNSNRFKRFKGRYFLVGCLLKQTQHGKPYWEMRLSDSATAVKIYCFDKGHFFSSFKANSLVYVEVCVKTHLGKPYLRCVYIEAVTQEPLINNLDIRAIPSALCPYPDLLKDTVNLFDSMDNGHLKKFVSQTLLQTDIADRFINCPSKIGSKQSVENCLLSKTLQVADRLLKDKSVNIEYRDIAIAFAFVHEIGKVKKVTSDGTLSAIAYTADLDDLTVEVCSLPLLQLSKKSKALSYQMRYLLTVGFTNKNGRFCENKFHSCLQHLTECVGHHSPKLLHHHLHAVAHMQL